MRRLLPIGLVVLARLLVHAQAAPVPTAPIAPTSPTEGRSRYRFAGQLVSRSSDGTLVPLFPDAVFVGWGDDGCQIERQSSERLNFYPDGVFQLRIAPLVTTAFLMQVEPPGPSTFTKSDKELLRWPCYRFRVEGCDDGIVQFGPTPPRRSIELACPGRKSNPRRDG